MEYYSAIKGNVFESILMRWMNLEPIIPSDVSHPNKCIWNLEKRVLKNFFMWQQWRNRHRK